MARRRVKIYKEKRLAQGLLFGGGEYTWGDMGPSIPSDESDIGANMFDMILGKPPVEQPTLTDDLDSLDDLDVSYNNIKELSESKKREKFTGKRFIVISFRDVVEKVRKKIGNSWDLWDVENDLDLCVNEMNQRRRMSLDIDVPDSIGSFRPTSKLRSPIPDFPRSKERRHSVDVYGKDASGITSEGSELPEPDSEAQIENHSSRPEAYSSNTSLAKNKYRVMKRKNGKGRLYRKNPRLYETAEHY